MRLEMLSTKSKNRFLATIDQLLLFDPAVEIYGMNAGKGIYYKGFWIGDKCAVKWDFGDIEYHTKAEAKGIIRYWNRLKWKPDQLSWMQLFKNWDEFGLYSHRNFEKSLLQTWHTTKLN